MVIDPNKLDVGSKDKNMTDPLSKSKLASESTENNADIAGVDPTSKSSDCELFTSPKIVVQSKDDSQNVAVKKRLGFYLFGGDNTIEQSDKDNQQRVKDNTAANSSTSL